MKRRSTVLDLLYLLKDIIVLGDIELRLAKAELKRNIVSAKKGIMKTVAGAFILLLAMLTLICSAVAALTLVLPFWLAALIVAAVLLVFGLALLSAGKNRLKSSLFLPTESLRRIKLVLKKLSEH